MIPAGSMPDAGLGVSYPPASSWGIDLDAIGAPSSGADVMDGAVSFTVRTGPFSGDLDAFVAEANQEIEDRFDLRIPGQQASVRTTRGVTGVGEAFGGPNLLRGGRDRDARRTTPSTSPADTTLLSVIEYPDLASAQRSVAGILALQTLEFDSIETLWDVGEWVAMVREANA